MHDLIPPPFDEPEPIPPIQPMPPMPPMRPIINYPWYWDDDGVRVYRIENGERVYHDGTNTPEHLNLNESDPIYRPFLEWLVDTNPDTTFANDNITKIEELWNVGLAHISQEAPFFLKTLLRKLGFQAKMDEDTNGTSYKKL